MVQNEWPRIQTDETLRETVSHGSADYAFRYYYEDFWQFDFHCVDWHWHPEVEFLIMEKGSAVMFAGSDRVSVPEGYGAFINTQVIHRFDAESSTVTPNIVFSPNLLAERNSLIFRKYIHPILISSAPYRIFSPEIPWQREILTLLQEVFTVQREPEPSELETVTKLMTLWEILFRHTDLTDDSAAATKDAFRQARLQILLQYIQSNHSKTITLEELAGTVKLSKSSVGNLFRRYLHISPMDYVITCRLKTAARLLVTTEKSVSSISEESGFENIGYFHRQFKKRYGCTPGEYRKKDAAFLTE